MKPIFDNGHGGMIGGKYQTKGKRSKNWECGVLYEGMFNRWVVNRLVEKMDRAGLDYYHVSPETQDVPLWQRVERSNKIFAKDPKTYLLSIHANAGGGEGIEGFTSPGTTRSDKIGELFLRDLQRNFKGIQKMRVDKTDGDLDKEASFHVLKRSKSPALLIECGFMDHPEDYKRLWSEDYLERIVDSLFETIQKLM